ncbi:MAG: SRPBCC family protein [Polyangiales bacterium]
MRSTLLFSVLGIAAILLGAAFVLGLDAGPFTIERDTTIAATPDHVFDHLEDLHRWETWFPWLQAKNTKRTYLGAAKGVGAGCEWENETQGKNRLTITESRAPELLTTRLDFTHGRSRQFILKLTLEPQGAQTHARITLTGNDTQASKLFDRFKTYITKDLDHALKNLAQTAAK